MSSRLRTHIDRLFPFHLVVDAELRVLGVGPSLARKLDGDGLGRNLLELVQIERPAMPSPTLADILHRGPAMFVLALRASELRLRGEFVAFDDGALFVGSPWLTSLAQTKQLGLKFDDFAHHDPSAELLVALEGMHTATRDANRLAEQLRAEVHQREQALEELTQKLELIERQRHEIASLSLPLLQLWDGILAVPLIGTLDEQRADALMQRLLDALARTPTQFAILDVTGVESIDTATAESFTRIISAITLLGSKGVISGIGPHIAQTLANLGVDLGDVPTCATLREALATCLRARLRASG